jgi:predicted alpha/beta hydrolase family esterase
MNLNRLEHVTIIPGWTLRPENNWYQAAADFIQASTNTPVHIAEMPNPDSPDPVAWTETLKQLIQAPEKELVIAHSLGFMATINWAAGQAKENKDFKLGGLISVAGNINAVGFSEIAPHFDHPEPVEPFEGIRHYTDDDLNSEGTKKLLAFGDKMELVQRSLHYRPVAIHGKHDPFVPFEHARVIRELLDGNMIVDQTQAHFSGLYEPEHGEPILPTQDTHVGSAYFTPRNSRALYLQMPWVAIGFTAVDMIRASHYLHAKEQARIAARAAPIHSGDPVLDSINRIAATMR